MARGRARKAFPQVLRNRSVLAACRRNVVAAAQAPRAAFGEQKGDASCATDGGQREGSGSGKPPS